MFHPKVAGMRIISFAPLHEQRLPLMELNAHQRRILCVEHLGELLGHLAELRIEQENLAVARTLAEEIRAIADKMNRSTRHGYVIRVVGRFSQLQRVYVAAESHLRRGLDLMGDTPYERALSILAFESMLAGTSDEVTIDARGLWKQSASILSSLGANFDEEFIVELFQKHDAEGAT